MFYAALFSFSAFQFFTLTIIGLTIMASLDTLKAQISANQDAVQSAVALIQGLADRLRSAQNDPQAIADLVTELQNSDTALAAAVTANTPAASDAQKEAASASVPSTAVTPANPSTEAAKAADDGANPSGDSK